MSPTVLAAALAAFAAALPAAAAVETYTIDPNHTFPSFEIGHFGYSIQRGRFNKTSGKVTLDSAARTGTVDVTMETASINTGHPKLEEHIRSEDFLDAAKYPALTFKGTGFLFDGEQIKSVTGDLTMKGQAHPVTLEAQQFRCAPHPMTKKQVCGGEFVAKIKRSEWGITKYVPVLADEMLLRINVEAIRD